MNTPEPDDLSAEAVKLLASVNGLIDVASAYLQTDQGKAVLRRGSLLLDAIGSGGFMPSDGAFSSRWLAVFLSRHDDSVERQARKLKARNCGAGNQQLFRAEDMIKAK